MTRLFGRNSVNTQRAFSRLMMTSALVAAGTLVLSSSAMADPWSDVTGVGVSNTSGGAGITNIVATTANGKASGTGNLDILAGETVNIDAKLFVARDNRANIKTSILGELNSNGAVILIDRNGIIFGKDSRVDVGSLIATTGDVSDSLALANGNAPLLFSNFGTGEIVNNGVIKTAGTAGDYGLAAFVGPVVKNNGVITAYMGRVSLAAGDNTATVDLYGDGLVELALTNNRSSKFLAENTGKIEAIGGKIQMTAASARNAVDSVVNMNGIARANSATVSGGKIILSADTVNVGAYATVKGDTKITAKSAKLGTSIDGTLSGSADTVNVVSNKAKIADALNIINTNGTVNVGAGTYNEHLVVSKAGVTINGAKAGVNGAAASRGTGETIINPMSPGVEITANNVTIDGLTFADAFGLTGYGIYVNGADNVTLKNNVIRNTDQSGIYVVNSNGTIITNNSIGASGVAGNVQADGIRLIRGNNAIITGNTIANVGTVGTGYGSGIYAVLSSGLQIGGATVALGNTITNAVWDGVKLVSDNGAVVQNNTTTNVGRAGVSVATSNGVTIANNTSTNSGFWGIWAQSSNGLDILNNVVTGVTTEHGVLIDRGADVLVSGNIISGTTLAGINADNVSTNADGGLVISNNTIDNTGTYGMWVAGSDGSQIIGNKIGTLGGVGNIQSDGIRIVESDNSVVQSNTITQTKPTVSNGSGSGIYSLFNDNIIIGGAGFENIISNTGWDGIKIQGGTGAQVLENTVSGVGRAGVSAYQTTNAVISNVDLTNSKQWGIWSARNIGLTITGSNIDGTSTNEGIYSFADTNLLVDTVTIKNTKTSGIFVESAIAGVGVPSVTLTNNTIDLTGSTTSAGHGIYWSTPINESGVQVSL